MLMQPQLGQKSSKYIENLYLKTNSKLNIQIKRLGLIANETSIHQSLNEVDVSNYRQFGKDGHTNRQWHIAQPW